MVHYDRRYQDMEVICDSCGYSGHFLGEEHECRDQAERRGWEINYGEDKCWSCAMDDKREDEGDGDEQSIRERFMD